MWRLRAGNGKETERAFAFAGDLEGKGKELSGLVKVDFGAMGMYPLFSLSYKSLFPHHSHRLRRASLS